MKKTYFHFMGFIFLTFFVGVSYADEFIEEYGTVLIFEKKCTDAAIELNHELEKLLPNLENVKNHWHVTLYHGAYKNADLPKIKEELRQMIPHSLNLSFTHFYTTSDRWVDWGTQKNPQLQKLHENVVGVLSPFHVRPLKRAKDIYDSLDSERKHQVDIYGVSGVMHLYNPHMTLFYTYPPSEIIRKTIAHIKNSKYENLNCSVEEIMVGKLGYNGNIIEPVYRIPLKAESK